MTFCIARWRSEIYGSHDEPGAHGSIEGIEQYRQGDPHRSIAHRPHAALESRPPTPGCSRPIRDLYAMLPESRERGYKPGRFSFNVKGGRCEACQGDGLKRIEMNFLPDVYVTCDVCRGRRYNHETLQVKYKGHSIADLLETTVEEALAADGEHCRRSTPSCRRCYDVGLGYVHLGQSSTTLSGGEAQRIKLAKELSKRQTGRTFYLLDEPTTGLHFDDVRKLLDVLQRLVDLGNTVVVIEHNLDVMKTRRLDHRSGSRWRRERRPHGGGRHAGAGEPIEEELHGRGAAQESWEREGRHEQVPRAAAGFRRAQDHPLARARRQGEDADFRHALSRRARALPGWLDSLPHILAGDSFRAVVDALASRARPSSAPSSGAWAGT